MEKKDSLSFRQKVFYGVGEIASTLSDTVIGFLYVFYLTNVMGMEAWLAGLVYFIGAAWDAITDPIVGYLSDISRSKFGRRRIYFLASALPFAVMFFLIWAVPAGWSQGGMFAYAAISYMIYRTTSTLFIIPYNTYGMEIVKGYDGRTSLQSYRFFFSILFGLIAAAVPEMITTLPLDPTVPEGMPSMAGYMLMAGCLAIPILICPVFTFFACKEKPCNNDPRSNFIKKFGSTFRNPYFRKALGMYVCSWITIGVVQSLLMYYLGAIGQSENFALIAAIIMGTAVVCLPIWVWISKKLDKKQAYIIGMVIGGISLGILALPADFINSIIWVLLPIIGFGISSMHMIPNAILPESIEAGCLKQPDTKASEGVYYGVVTFSQKLGTAVTIQLATYLMTLSGYISTEQGQVVQQPQAAMDCTRLLMGLIPVVLVIIGIIFAVRFKIGREESEKIRAQLDKTERQ